jgi:hypothetical protein
MRRGEEFEEIKKENRTVIDFPYQIKDINTLVLKDLLHYLNKDETQVIEFLENLNK